MAMPCMPGLCSCPPRFRVKSISARKKSAGSSFSTGLHSRHHALQGVRTVLRKADRPRRHCHPLTRLIVALSQELKRLTAQLSRRPSRENSSERALLWMRHRAALSFCISGLPSETGRGQQTVFGLGCPAKAARKPDFRVASRSGCRQAQRNDLGHFCYGCGLLPRNLGLHAGSVTETCGSTGNL